MRALHQPPRYASLGAALLILVAAALLFLANQGPGSVVSPASAVICDADSGPAIVTDRVEYLPTEVAVVSGCGFEAYNGQTLTISITEPDAVVFTDNITIGSSGEFAYSYVIPDKQGTYNVAVLDGTTVLASTTFLDDYYVDPTNLMFVVEQGGNPASQTFTLVVPTSCDDAGGVITDNQSWISTAGSWATGAWLAGPGSGNVHVNLTVNVTSNALAIGTYTGTVTVDPSDTSSGCSGTKQVAIRLYVVRPNPVLPASCGLDVGLVIDSSGSIDSTELGQMKTAFQSFVNAFLPATPTQISVVDFDTTAVALGGGAWSNNAATVNGWVNTPTSGGRTNWDDGLSKSRGLFPNRTNPDLIIFASDGNPNEWGNNNGDPLTQDNAVPPITALQKAIDEANAAKASGIRVLTLGIGNQLSTTHLAAISSWDAVTTSNFSTLATTLSNLAVQMCGGTVTAKKMLDLDNNLATTGDQVPAQNWTMTTNVNSPDFSTPVSGLTDSGGQINFDIDLGGDGTATLSVTETMQTGYVFMAAECKKGATPLGTPGSGTVTGVVIGAQDIVSCTFWNLPQRTFTVNKDFVPNNAASVTASLSCASGTSSPASGSVTESTPGVFTVTGYLGNPTCTATESPIPSGYASTGTCAASLTTGSCTIVNTLRSGTFTISKDFIPNSANSVAVSVSCTSGTPAPASGSFSESSPLMVTVTGFNAGATCTATETVPGGYTANQAPCANKALVDGGNVNCTITNTLTAGTFLVNKDFIPNNAASVSVSVSCASGTPSPASGSASEATPFMTTVSGYSGNPICTATESPIPTGYSSSATCNATISVGQCTITNTLNSATLSVYKDFIPNNAATVSVSVTCTTGTPSPASGSSSETTPFSTTITGFTAGATCTATETEPSGYTANQTNCASVAISVSGSHSCTIVNDLNTHAFIVNKDFIPNNGASVNVSISCASGTPTPASGTATETTPFNTIVTGYTGNPTCTATESPIPTGYSSSGTCNATITVGSCTIVNTLNSATFTVVKDFVPNNAATVSVSILCTSGTPSPSSGSASEATPFSTTVTGYSVGATCTATETVPSGYTSTGTCSGAITGAPSGSGTCTITNNLKSGTFTVNKNFLPDSGASVAVSVTCTSGTPSPASGGTTESTPFVTTVTGFDSGATCTATETAPDGYTVNQADCATKTIVNGGNVSCTITNTLNSGTFAVNKDFIPNSGASVSVSMTCTSGTPSPASGSASEAIPFVTTVTGFTAGATCTATETVPGGYTANQANCLNVAIGVGGSHSCTITNTNTSATLKVKKSFSPSNGASVSVSVTCTSGTPTPASGSASEALAFSTTITGFTAGTTCTATESPEPAGYTASQANCAGVAISNGGASLCTITNTLNSATLTVNKDFVPNNGASVAVSVTCTSGTPSPASGSASEATPFVTTITGFSTGATCTATETVPGGYIANQAACVSVGIINGGASSCTIINTLKSGTFTVNKDFLPNNAASVAVSVSCSSGTPMPASGSASEATPFVTTVTGFLLSASCTATETAPTGYTASQAGCAGVVLNNGGNVSCTITNTLNSATLTVNKDFIPNSGSSVAVSVTCTSGTPAPTSGSASEATPFVTTITGFTVGATCTTTETVPGGYTASQANCASVSILVNGSHSCTITNDQEPALLFINKDFVPNNGASVAVSVTCTSGTPTPTSGTMSEATPFNTVITGYTGNPTCTATESPIPTGYSSSGTCNATFTIGSCTITNTLNTATLTVNKDFVPNNGASVSVSVTCTSGTPTPASGSASEATPFFTTITGFSMGATCTTTETAPGGYTVNQAPCASVAIAPSGSHSCTITNTLNSATLTVNKTFSPSSGASVAVSVTCSSGTPAPASGSATTATPFTTTITGFTVGATCTATETVPGGYTANQTNCASVAIAVSGSHSCTITNTLNTATFTVNKDFVPNNGASVSVSITCTSGTPAPTSGSASEATPFSTTVTGYTVGATCTATESPIPAGYTSTGTCTGTIVGAPSGIGSCTITNDLNTATFTVNKTFSPASGASVSVSITCTTGTPSPASGLASTATPFVSTITSFTVGATCTATETQPTGYTKDETACAGVAISPGGSSSCTILNNVNFAVFQVGKDFSDNNAADVTVSLLCTTGTTSSTDTTASEGDMADFTVSGFTPGGSCTATETAVPAGYSSSGTCSAPIATGSCTILNELNTATFTVNKTFSPASGASVSVSISCTSGTPAPASGSASTATPFTTTVTGYTAGASCTATESPIPAGYISSGVCSGVISGAPSGTGSCTITNTARITTLTVNKDFVPNSGASVAISVTCTSGTPSPATGSASEATPFTTTVTAFSLGATCTATETIPGGYIANQAPCVSIAMVNAVPASCTITNTPQATFTVYKDFSDDNAAPVTVTLSCTLGTPSPASAPAVEGSPTTFTVTGATGATVCTANESGVPAGYTVSSCQNTMTTGSCTIVNNAVAAFTVSKDFIPNDGASVTVTLVCMSGTVSPPSASVSEGAPWGFTVSGYTPSTTCTATESPIPPGYTSTGTCTAPISIPSHAGACTIVNTLGTVGPVTVTPSPPTPSPCVSNCPVGGEVFLPRAVSGPGGSDGAVGLAVMILIGVVAVASIGGSWKMSRRSRD